LPDHIGGLIGHNAPDRGEIHLNGEPVVRRKRDAAVDIRDGWLTAVVENQIPFGVNAHVGGDGLLAKADFHDVDLLFFGIDRIDAAHFFLDAGLRAGLGIVGEVRHDADIPRRNLDPSRGLNLVVLPGKRHELDRLEDVRVRIDAVAAGREGLPQEPLEFRLPEIPVDQKFIVQRTIAHLARCQADRARLDELIGNQRAATTTGSKSAVRAGHLF
jgi:hypothetical protein